MSAFVDSSVSKGTNIREFPYLSENVRTWTTGAPSIRRNPFTPIEMLSSGMMMAQAQSAGMGRNLSKKEKESLVVILKITAKVVCFSTVLLGAEA